VCTPGQQGECARVVLRACETAVEGDGAAFALPDVAVAWAEI